MRRVLEQARLAGLTGLPITLVGEPGTGKRWLARAIHLRGPARQRYFAALDCARLPPPVLAELPLGPTARQLTLGTVYLREPQRLPREVQARLADLLGGDHTRDPDWGPRLIVGLSADPQEAVRGGLLLEELACLTGALTIALPPLRQRLDELSALVEQFLERARQVSPHPVRRASAEAMAVLRAYAWPGNVRELAAVVAGACRRAKGEQVEPADLPFHLRHGPLPAERQLPLDTLLEQAERRLIALALRLSNDNKTRAAELLAIWRPRLIRRMEHFGMGQAGPDDAE